MKTPHIPTNASVTLSRASSRTVLFGRRVTEGAQLKGALALAIEKELNRTYAPLHWIYGPSGHGAKGTWPIPRVCPVVWAYAGVLYGKFPEWLRDELLPLAGRIAASKTNAKGRRERALALGRYAIDESFRMSDFGPVQDRKAELLLSFNDTPAVAYTLCRDTLNSIQAPDSGIPLLTTLGGLSLIGDKDHLCALRNSVLSVGEIPARVAEEAPTRSEFLATWERALKTLVQIME